MYSRNFEKLLILKHGDLCLLIIPEICDFHGTLFIRPTPEAKDSNTKGKYFKRSDVMCTALCVCYKVNGYEAKGM